MAQLLKYLKICTSVFFGDQFLNERANLWYNVHSRVKFRNKILVWYGSIEVKQFNDKITCFFRGLKIWHNLEKCDFQVTFSEEYHCYRRVSGFDEYSVSQHHSCTCWYTCSCVCPFMFLFFPFRLRPTHRLTMASMIAQRITLKNQLPCLLSF